MSRRSGRAQPEIRSRKDEGGKTTEYMPTVNMYEEEDKVFIEAVRTGKTTHIRSPYSDAIKSFSVTCAANESIESGMPVKP